MIIDPDKKVAEAQKKAEGTYQSKKHPNHFESEGGEYIEDTSNKKGNIDTMPEQVNKIKDERNQEK
jgi:hypothetical protein